MIPPKEVSQAKLGFLGLGAMGQPIVQNILKAGFRTTVFDLVPERIAVAVKNGAVAAKNAKELVAQADIVFTSLPTSPAFVKLCEEILLPNARPGQIFIDLGTVIPFEIRRLATALAIQEAYLLDVPVSGGVQGAEQAQLFMFVGGNEAVFQYCLPLLKVVGSDEHLTYCGESGSGQIVKGVNQLMMALADAAYMEALAFGVRTGLSAELLQKALNGAGRWRSDLAVVAQQVITGRGEQITVKFRELPYFLKEAHEQGFALPITQVLYQFCEGGERVIIDDNQLAPSFWHELMLAK